MYFTAKCPHCGFEQRQGLAEDLDFATISLLLGGEKTSTTCTNCGAHYLIAFVVRSHTYVASLDRLALLAVRTAGQRVARAVQRILKGATRHQPTPLPVFRCGGCERKFGAGTGYPAPLADEGLCAVCSQEVKRRLAQRRAA